MPSPSFSTLRSLAAESGSPAARFIADEERRTGLDELIGGPDSGERFAGRTVMVACGRQAPTAAALLRLDGSARRIVLCPPDLAAQHRPFVIAETGTELVVSEDASADCGLAVVEAGPTGSGASSGRTAEPGPTEWILFTSGTTGRPKMVVHTLQTLAGHLPTGAPRGGPVTWCTFYDVRRYGGMQILLRAMIGGGSLVLSAAGEAPGAFMARAASFGATHFLGTPSHWRRALMTDEFDRIAPDYVRLSGEPADQTILDRLRARFPRARIVHAFAATETGVAFEIEDGRAGFPASLLEADGDVALQVRDGSLRVRSTRIGAALSDGVARPFANEDGFVDTGDMIERDGDRCRFAGRREGIVNVGGQKVHPEEIESVINQHPGVAMSLVRSRPNPITGAVVVAEIVAKGSPAPGREPELSREVLDLCRRHLPAHKVPATVRVVPSLALAPSGKLVRLHA
jgi:acyl-coenzyme A synthetase/AMP-(fatty) acid ligase